MAAGGGAADQRLQPVGRAGTDRCADTDTRGITASDGVARAGTDCIAHAHADSERNARRIGLAEPAADGLGFTAAQRDADAGRDGHTDSRADRAAGHRGGGVRAGQR